MVDHKDIPDFMRWLDADALGRIRRMELIARGVVEGFISGRHRSPYMGFSPEFAEHREYVPGDNIRDLDWRLFARSDRYYIKQYIDETNLRATILLDCSGSMQYAGTLSAPMDGNPVSKFDYARYLAASLAHLLMGQQDAVGLVTFDDKILRYIPARSRTTHLRVLLQEITETEPGLETDPAEVFHMIAETVSRRGLIIIISDMFGDPEKLLEAMHHFRFRKHEVVLLHVMAEEELTFPFERWSQFDDLEKPAEFVQVDPRAIRAAYLDEVQRFIKTLSDGCGGLHVDYVQMSTQRRFDVCLSEYLAHRKKIASIGRR